jgi:branched-chain amino acid transport system ATP-binding protein
MTGPLLGVSDVSLEVPEGSVVALLGCNGGGKTTTLNAIAGLIPVCSGSITFHGEEIGGQNAFSIVRKGLGAVAGRLAAVRAAERGE